MRILSWNIACLPNKINIIGNPNKRLPHIIQHITHTRPDIICLQEVFCFGVFKKIKESLTSLGFHIHHSPLTGLISQNGLLTATQFPILETHQIDYSMFTGAEYLIKKGLLTSYVSTPYGPIIVHNTHLQSNSIYTWKKICSEVRQKQKKEVIKHLTQHSIYPSLLCGDLNDDFYSTEHQKFLQQLPFTHYTSNLQKLITFPKHKQQLDYIILNRKIPVNFQELQHQPINTSDHHRLLAEITNPENLHS